MLDKLTAIPQRLAEWAGSLTAPALAVIGVVIVAGVGAGGYYAYETYDYVQHDNDFCMSCHLMQQPYELFAQSAHQGLGCKACHQPTLMVRSQMALTQIIENPAELETHAEVPNERCAECHIKGDPEKWRLVANSAGHRAHLESDDPALEGLQCVECHSTSLHEFAPVDRTCSQSGCHDDKTIKLGEMSNLTIHCAACHSFLAPVGGAQSASSVLGNSIDAALLPDQEECLSCHAMRERVQMPRPDPHRGVCAACHNPHTQSTPAEAGQSCTNAGCHNDPLQDSPMHRGLQPGVIETCTACHTAHDFKVDGSRCIDCHQGVLNDNPAATPGAARPDSAVAHLPESLGLPAVAGLAPAGAGIGWWSHDAPLDAAPAAPQSQERPHFLHSQHRAVNCTNCHVNTESHGGLKVVTLNDCRSCHHNAPLANDCSRCHTPADAPTRSFRETRSMQLSVGPGDPQRVMNYPHDKHSELPCGSCHTQGLTRDASAVDCASCHEDHHDVANDCASCHRQAPASAHPQAEAHVTCTGSGCHTNPPFQVAPRSRTSCLVCHQDMKDHQPGRECADCHTLPSPRGGGGGAHP
jgi:nitrate/TMAO reductase-like tetraheme cytochrome c subunit